MKILVVDDDPDVFEVVSLCFEMRWPNAEVIHASCGELGIELAQEEAPDLVVLDLELPDVDWLQVCAEIRRFSTVPIIILTVRDSPEDEMRGLELGADDYIRKPFSPVELQARAYALSRRARITETQKEELVCQMGDLFLHFSGTRVLLNGEPLHLTSTEYQVLYYLVSNAGRTIESEQLTDIILGEKMAEGAEYLPIHLRRLNEKLRNLPISKSVAVQDAEGGYLLSVGDR